MTRSPRRTPSGRHPVPHRTVSYRGPDADTRPSSATNETLNPHGLLSTTQRLRTRSRQAGWSFEAPRVASVTPDRLGIVLPAPPSINHQYATVNGRRILSAVGREYKTLVARDIMVALARSPHRDAFLTTARRGPLALSIHFFFTSPLRRDVDGGLKIAQDALCEALGINDNRIHEIHLFKKQDPACPRIEVTLCPSSPPPPPA